MNQTMSFTLCFMPLLLKELMTPKNETTTLFIEKEEQALRTSVTSIKQHFHCSSIDLVNCSIVNAFVMEAQWMLKKSNKSERG
mgnify:CR=1 FL=1